MAKTPLIYTHIGNSTTIAISASFDTEQRLNESANVVVILNLLYGICSIWWRATAETPTSVVVDGSGDASDLETDGEVVYKMVF